MVCFLFYYPRKKELSCFLLELYTEKFRLAILLSRKYAKKGACCSHAVQHPADKRSDCSGKPGGEVAECEENESKDSVDPSAQLRRRSASQKREYKSVVMKELVFYSL